MEQSMESFFDGLVHAGLGDGEMDEVKPYRIHVASKYLDLTRKKLKLTRLPHELLLPSDREWSLGTPKSEVEPLVDFWLEHYSWRSRETHLNTSLPQFRTAIPVSGCPHPLRIHFIHLRSSHADAIPLLLLPSFPLTNVSLAPLFASLVDPDAGQPAFHVVVPSLPGLGFSDPFQTDEGLAEKTMGVVNALMLRLNYTFYLASGTGDGRGSPGGMDYYLLRMLGEGYPESCLGVHMIEPCVERPKLSGHHPWEWVKLVFARLFGAEIFGYTQQDFTALKASAAKLAETTKRDGDKVRQVVVRGVGMLGLTQPHTLSYALCDSPVGLLSLVCAALRKATPTHRLSPMEVVDLTQLAWLPGPEAGMRFCGAVVNEIQSLSTERRKGRKSRIAVTVFGADGSEDYRCPTWANTRHQVLWAQRIPGCIGIPVWERSCTLVDGIRGLASAVKGVDRRLEVRELAGVVVDGVESGHGGGGGEEERDSVLDIQLDLDSLDMTVTV